jgi:diacylglycerol kinase (ATP)
LEFRISNLESRIIMKLSIIANPVAGGGRPYKSIQRYVRQWAHPDWEVEILTTQDPDHAGTLARGLLRHPPDLLAVCGGDGTINEVASHIPHPPFPIAILPAGTANVVARELGLPLNPIQALRVALKGAVKKVNLGELGPESSRRFLFVAGIGFDAYVVSSVKPGFKSRLGMAAYAVAIINGLRSYSFPEFQVTVGNQAFVATSCLACNMKGYGGGLLFCPDADMSDGLLDIVILQGRRRLGLIYFLLMAWIKRPLILDWVHRLQARTLRIEGPACVPVQTDGELAGCLPLEIGLADANFPLIVP